MATLGTVTITEQTWSVMQRLKFEWKASSTGGAEDTTTNSYDGLVYRVIIFPSTGTPPDQNYNVAINDSDGYDILNGLGTKSSTDSANYYGISTGGGTKSPITAVSSELTLAVTGAGSSNSGEVIVYIR